MAEANVSLADASKLAGGFYVPQVRISAQGTEFPQQVIHDIVELTYKDKLEEIDSCEIVVNNWDAKQGCFKYIGSEDLTTDGKPSGSAGNNPNAPLWTLFDPCTRNVTVELGYAPGPLTKMLVGNFVTYEPNFPASGPPVLSVRMLNLLHKLRNEKQDEQYTPDKVKPLKDSLIAKYIDSKKRLPVPIHVPDGQDGGEPELTYVIQKSQYDIDFLWQRARTRGYELRINEAGEVEFSPSINKNKPVYRLTWGQSLIDFKPTLTTGNQYKSVTVRGFDRATQTVIEEKVDLKEIGKLNKNLHYLLDQCDPREETVIDKPMFTKDQAKEYARSTFTDQLKRMVKATGTTIGLPELRAGCHVLIGSAPGSKLTLGTRLSGTYFVTATTHVFNSSGYTTKFEARREDEDYRPTR
jgi:phage protein D